MNPIIAILLFLIGLVLIGTGIMCCVCCARRNRQLRAAAAAAAHGQAQLPAARTSP
jgi:hypothetical protein